MYRIQQFGWLVGLALIGTVQAESLYSETSYRALTADRKAHRQGDGLTVLIYEMSSASSNADTTAQRRQGAGVEVADSLKIPHGGNIRTNNDFDGQGRTRRSGQLLAQITVTVQSVAENGDLLVSGQQHIEINNERQEIKLEGRVRQADITDANTVLSTRLADARLTYRGDGDLAERQKPSWWSKLLLWLGL